MASHVDSSVTVPSQTAHEPSGMDWLDKNRKPLSYGAVALVVVVLGAWLWSETGKRKAVAAADAIDRARSAFEMGNLPLASTEFQRVAQSFAGTEAGYQAELALNEVRLAGGQSQLAADELRKFVEKSPPATYMAGAHLLLGAALENLNKFDDAAAAYKLASEEANEDYRQVEALVSAARATRLGGKEKEALDILRGVVAKYSGDVAGVAEAEVRLAEWTQGKN